MLDSTTPDASGVRDAADMYELADGDVLEVGQNEGGGRYEELWTDVPVGMVADERGRRCVVLETEGGMVVRVGDACQGIVRGWQGVCVERWNWGAEKGWERAVRIGEGDVPCAVTFEVERIEEGGSVKVGGRVWTVREKYQWV